jgi:hypothetical protein
MVDLTAFKRDVKKDLNDGREAFEGRYASEINDLMGLSKEEIDRITPDNSDLAEYDRLISVVKQASRHNLSQAQLASNIRALGETAVSIAKKAKNVAKLLV